MRTIQRVNSSLSNSGSGNTPLSTSSSSTAVNYFRASSKQHLLDEEEQLTVRLHLDPDEEALCSTIEVIPGQSLIDSLTPFLTQNGVAPIQVEIFLENSKTPIPNLSQSRFLVGQKLNVKLKPQNQETPPKMVSRLDTKASRSVDEQELRIYDETDSAKLYYTDKAGSSRNLLGPASFYDPNSNNNFTVPRRKGSLNVDPSVSSGLNSPIGIDDRFYGPPDLYAVPNLSGSLNGTRRLRAPSNTRRSTLFGGKMEKFTTILDRIYKPIEETSLLKSAIYELEKHYSDVVVKSRKIEHNDIRRHQEAIWEIVTTEHRYIKFLGNMCDLHKTLLEAQQRGFLHEIDPQMVFLNFSDIFRASIEFWHRGILIMLNHSRQTGECLNALLMREAFDDISVWSRCYLDFNINYNNSHSYIQKKMKENETFADFVRWIESKPFMNRQRLIDILTAPVQHLTRYPLMLRSVVHSTQHKDEKLQIQTMLDKADEANMTLNHFLSNNDILIQLIEIMKTVESYDAVDGDEYSKFVPPYCPPFLNLTQPMKYALSHSHTLRRVFTRGDLKLKESKTAPKVEVHCILFTDMLLICKSTSRRTDRFRIYKPPMILCRLKTIPFTEGNGFYIVSFDRFDAPSNFYMFYTVNQEESKRWIELIEIAQSEYTKLTNDPENTLHGFSQKQFLYRGQDMMQLHYPPETIAFYHRKSHSMDSQAIAHHATTNGLRREAEVASAEQLDRRGYDQYPPLPHQNSHTSYHHPISSTNPNSSNSTLNRPQKILVDDDPTLEKVPSLDLHEHPHSEDKESLDSGREVGDETTPSTEENTSGRTSSAGRRFEKRYHTVGEVETKTTPLNSINSQQTILKRFSWNVGSQKKISRLSDKLQTTKPTLQHSRRFSQSTTESNDSFGSSTSGISTSSSHDTSIQNGSTDPIPNCHISRVRIEEQMEQHHHHQSTIGSPTSTTTITTGNCTSPVVKRDSLALESSETLIYVEKPPPLPHRPPPDTDQSCSSDEHEENDPNLMQNSMFSDQQPDLLKLILNDDLDTSIV